MFFRRQKGQYRETDRVTRYKLVKSGKHWLRASTSLFGLFKVLRGGVDTTQVMTEVVENQTNQTITGLDIIRGIAATGAVLGGTVATQTKVFANEAVALEKTLDSSDALATHDTVVLGTTAKVDAENSASLSHSVSESVSSSESISTSLSASVSSSASMSTSASESASTSASVSAGTSVSSSQSMVASDNSALSTTASETSGKTESVSKESQLAKEGLSASKLGAPVLESAKLEKGLVDTNAEISSLAGVTAGAIATSEVSAKQQDENRKKLTKLSVEMGEYLAKAVGLPNSDAAIAKVNAAVTAIETALANPKADLTETVKLATSARNSIANAVLRVNSGARDARNGQGMGNGAHPRALPTSLITNTFASNRTSASLESGQYNKNTHEVIWRINMHSDNALDYAGLLANVDPNTTITRVTFNNQPMEKRGGSGNEYIFNKRHDLNRNLEATIEVHATVNEKSSNARLDARVATSSQPFTSTNVSGNYTNLMTSYVHTGRAGSQNGAVRNQGRATDNPPTVELPKLLEVFNDDSVNINMVFRDDKALRFFYKGNNPIITGLQGKNFPGQINFATLKQDPKTGLNTAYVYEQKQWITEIYGTIGRDNGWKPMTPGDYNIEYGADDTAGQKTMTTMTVRIHGFNERQSPISGATVAVNNTTNLSQAEKDQVLANFKAANANVLSSTDYKKGSEEGSISVANNGDVTITYRDRTTDTVTNNVKYGVEKTTDHFYAVSNESVSSVNPSSLVRPVGGVANFPKGTTVAWKQGQAPTMAVGTRTATVTVTHPDKTTTDLTYNYTVYPKIETKNNNGVTGQFYAFKAASGDKTVGNSYANNIGGDSYLYINNPSLPSGTTFAYEYRLNNNASAPVSSQAGSPKFSTVWHTTADSATTHRTTYTAKATYLKGRLGNVTASNPALTSTVTFDYTVVDPVAKQEYVTTVGNTTPLNDIISNPSNAVKNSDSSVAIPTGTDYTWVSAPDASSPGIYKKEVKVTLPQGSTDKPRNATNVPVTIKVRPNPPQISTDQVTNTGGLPNKRITVTNALPNAQVTLTIGGKTLTKQADGNGNVTFPSTDVADRNGLLPIGNVTVKQSKVFDNPVTGQKETLTSDERRVEISKETEKPHVRYKVTIDGKEPEKDSKGYYLFYAGDNIKVEFSATDNSGKLKRVTFNQGGNELTNFFNDTNNTYGSGAVPKIESTVNQDQTTSVTIGKVKDDLTYDSGHKWTRQIKAVDPSGNESDTSLAEANFGIQQGRLADKIELTTPPVIPVRDKSNLTPTEREKIKSEVEKSNPSDTSRIRTYEVQPNGDVVITFKDGTSKTVTPNLEQNYKTKSERFYAVAGENPNSLTARNFIKSADGTELPANTNVVWKNGAPDLSTPGDKTATLTVTDSKGVSKDITYNYTVYPKVEAHSRNGVSEFYAFKGTEGQSLDRIPEGRSGNWANNIGGTIEEYTNLRDSRLSGTKWSYKYKLNNQGAEITTPADNRRFGDVWNTTGSEGKSHSTRYTLTATYPNARFGGAASADNPALTSDTSFNYTVVDPVAAQPEFVTTAGDKAPIKNILDNPGAALSNSNSSVAFPSGTTYSWTERLSDTELATPGVYTKKVRITLPQGSYSGEGNTRTVPVTIKVKPKTPQIADNQVKLQGGLPKRSITVTDVTPGATVTLTIGNQTIGTKTFTKVAGPNDTSLTFTPKDLEKAYNANNGLLPTGDVTVKQEKVVPTPTGGTETLTSDTTSTTITKEDVAPTVTYTIKVNGKVPEKNSEGRYKFYAGDKIEVTFTGKDNSGKLASLKMQGNGKELTDFFEGRSEWGSGNISNITTTTSDDHTTVTVTATANSNLTYKDGNKWNRQVEATDPSGNKASENFGVQQDKLENLFKKPVIAATEVKNKNALTDDDKEKVREEIRKAHDNVIPNGRERISSIEVAPNGVATVYYKDNAKVASGSQPYAPTVYNQDETVSDRVYKSESASISASTSASESASTSASESARTSASQSASTSASESASTSASESASTSASESASTSASESASTSASESASTSASESASTSASESASTSASESASTSASESASTSASESASTSASESASTSASESASTSASESASTSASESASTSASESASTSASESASTSASESASTSASESASTSASESASTSASESASTSASESASTSASESASTSASESASTSASESASTSASESASTSASESASTSASQSASTSASESASTSASESASTSASESASTSASESASTSASESASTSASESASTSASESASTSASESASTSASESASTSASQSASTSASESASTSASESASTSASESASTSASTSMSVPDSTDKPNFSLSDSASQSTSLSVSVSTSVSMSTSTSTSLSGATSESASTSSSLVESNVDHSTSHVGNDARQTAKSRQQLPNTGTEVSKSSVLLGALTAVTGLGLIAKRRKRDDEEEM